MNNGVPLYVPEEKTQKIIVGRYAYGDVCKCGARVHIDPDRIEDPPAEVFYDAKTFQILACPVCVQVIR